MDEILIYGQTSITRLPDGLEKIKDMRLHVPSLPQFAAPPAIIGRTKVVWTRDGDHLDGWEKFRYYPDKYRRAAIERNEVQANVPYTGPDTDRPMSISDAKYAYEDCADLMSNRHRYELRMGL